MAEEEEIGRVMDYFAQISVAGIDLTRKLRVAADAYGNAQVDAGVSVLPQRRLT